MGRRPAKLERLLRLQRGRERYGAAMDTVAVWARLERMLGAEAVAEIRATWQALPADESYLPEQELAYLERVAEQYNVSLVGCGGL